MVVVELLLKHVKLNVNVQDDHHKTALHLAHEQHDLLENDRGVQGSHELLLNRMECARLIISADEASKKPNLLGLRADDDKHVYHYTLIHHFDTKKALKTEKQELSDAREIRESHELFEKMCEIVDKSNEYPAVARYRRNFAARYFLKIAIPYLLWLIALIVIGVAGTTRNNSATFFFAQSLRDTFLGNEWNDSPPKT